MRKRVFTTILLLIAVTMILLVLCVKIHSADESDTETPVNDESATRSTTDADTSVPTVSTVSEPERYIITENVPLPFDLQRTMQDACEKYNVPYALALAVAECESSFNLEADSGTCWGVMQIHPINYPRLRENGIEPTEYEGNITAGVFMLGELLDKYADTHKALMAYNCGETGAKRLWNQGYLTSKYSRKVVEKYEKWQEIINNNLEA